LLDTLGYRFQAGVWRHPERIALFLGDIIDRGPRIREALHIVHDMVVAGQAFCIMGNHEFNALGWSTPAPPETGKQFRPRRWPDRSAFRSGVGGAGQFCQRRIRPALARHRHAPAARHDAHRWRRPDTGILSHQVLGRRPADLWRRGVPARCLAGTR
nr:hypothetical protein [Tanacetum cinerariifolium]